MTFRFSLLLPLLFCCLSSFFAKGQTDSTQVDSLKQIPFFANWALGDSFRYAITEIKVVYKGDSTTTNDTIRYEADFIVVDSTAEEYIVIWDSHKGDDGEFGDFMAQASNDLQERMDSLGDFRIRFRTDELGQYGGIANADQVQRAMKVLAPEMATYIVGQDTTFSKMMDDRQRGVLAKYTAKEVVKNFTLEAMEAEFMVPVVHMLSPLGAQYMLYDTTEVSVDIEASLPGKTVLQHLRVYFDDFFPNDGYVHMKVFTQIDDADGILLIAESLRQQGHDENKIQDFVQNGYYREREDNDFYYFYGYGLGEGIDCYKEITVEAPGEERVVSIQQYLVDIIRAKEGE